MDTESYYFTPFCPNLVRRVADPWTGRAVGTSGQVSLCRRPPENVIEHGRCHPARERVLLAGVVAADEQDLASARSAGGRSQPGFYAVTEGGPGPRQRETGRAQHRPHRLPGEPAQADDNPDRRGHPRELRREPGGAGVTFGDRRLVRGRCAPDRGDHSRPDQPLAVAGPDRRRLGGKPAPVQRREQDITAAITREDPAGPVATVGGGRKAGDQHRGPLVAPAGDGTAPVPLPARRGPFDGGHLLPPLDQPRAGPADRLPGHQLGQDARPGGEGPYLRRVAGDRGGGGRRIVRPAGPRLHRPVTGPSTRRPRRPCRRPTARHRLPPGRDPGARHRLLTGDLLPARHAGPPAASDQAMPSRMSCSLASTSANPNLVMIASSTSAPPPITSTRPGCITPSRARSACGIASSRAVCSCTWPAPIRA